MGSVTFTYAKHAIDFPDKVAIQTRSETLTYKEWYEQVCKTANWLNSIRCTNKKVGILLPNGIPFLQLFAGASTAGWISITLDMKWKDNELDQRLTLSRPSVCITTREMYHKLNRVHANVLIWEEILEDIHQTPETDQHQIESTLPFYLGFTSGSTGQPKAFIRSHNSWIESFSCSQFDFHIKKEDHVLIPGALIHSHFLFGAISTLFLGGTIYLMEIFSPTQTLSFIQTNPITVVYVVPTMIAAFLKEMYTIEKHVKIISSGAKWEEHSKMRIRAMFRNLTMYEFYGASELSYVTVLSDEENRQKPDSVGKPCHNVEIQIRDSSMNVAKPNQTGKIYVKSNMIFLGYLEGENNNIQPIQDENGWITVDDMGYLDDDGYLYIVGREKNMILYGGINIFPEEIEAVLSLHPDVDIVAVVGQSDPYWGQIPVAVIMGKATKKELRVFCKKYLASYKIPRKWLFLNDIPLTTSRKIARGELKKIVEREVSVNE